MRFDWVIPCIDVSVGENGADIKGGGINYVRVAALPARISFTVLLKVVGLASDFAEDSPRGVEVNLTGPGLEHLVALNFEIPAGTVPPDQEGWEIAAFMPVAIRFTATRGGPHMLDLYLGTDRPQRLVDPGRRRSLPMIVEAAEGSA